MKIALRSLRKNGIYTAINIFGLAIGLAAALLIFRIVNFELSFNKNFKKYDRIVRVVTSERNPDSGESLSTCIPIPAMSVMRNTVSQFEQFSPVREMWANITVANPTGGAPLKKFGMTTPEIGFFVDPAFFQIFDFQWLAGDPATALTEIHTIVLTKTWAEKCFDDWKNAVGKTVFLDNLIPVVVTGVVEDLPKNCDLPLTILVSYPTLKAHRDLYFYDETEWGSCSSNNQVFALLRDAGQKSDAEAVLAKVGEKEYNEKRGFNNGKSHFIQPLSDLHFNEDFGSSGGHITPKNRLWILTSIGILILVMACFNFINLATARASLRAKEVGVRKTLGGSRGQLIAQFMGETVLIVSASVLLGIGIAAICSPLLKLISEVPDAWPFFSNPLIWMFLGAVAVTVTFFAGLYPAVSLSGFQPVQAMKSDVHRRSFGGVSLRQVLVVSQFVIAQALIVGAIITIKQLDFIQSKDLGFSKDLVFTFTMNSDSATVAKQKTLKAKLAEIPAVEAVSFSADQPLSGNTWNSNWNFGSDSEDEKFNIALKMCDADYQKTYGIRLAAGRWMNPSDTLKEAVLNMTAIKKLGFSNPEEALNQEIRLGGRRKMKLVGVAEDFHSHDFHREHEPTIMITRNMFYSEVGLKIRPTDLKTTVAAVQKVYDDVLPEQVFVGRFLDERIAEMYEAETKFSATCKGFGLLAILISCLGLFGLASHAAAQRTKEIGIRKVLGATVAGLTGLLAKDFLKLVAVAILIASPLAYYFMKNWLADFVYRIDIQWWMFVVAGFLAVLIAFLTVSFQAVKAALANPVESLRSE